MTDWISQLLRKDTAETGSYFKTHATIVCSDMTCLKCTGNIPVIPIVKTSEHQKFNIQLTKTAYSEHEHELRSKLV